MSKADAAKSFKPDQAVGPRGGANFFFFLFSREAEKRSFFVPALRRLCCTVRTLAFAGGGSVVQHPKRRRVDPCAGAQLRLGKPEVPPNPIAHPVFPESPVSYDCVTVDLPNPGHRYTVQDDEPDEEGKRLTYELIPRNVLALPPPAGSAAAWPEFPPASAVLGLYPGTSCLYKGEVVSPPSKYRQKPPTYVITFENDNGQQIPVDAGMVIEYPLGFD
ncbi:MAG: SGF29 tudor-like domain-containing protein [Olpidium bornovanus]|uniref:SGF29 tudor-like domain-containing protein n=1 Tax=Olpidium bornovanus TaxID=278681 RepID=A0A8H7ZN43_9FUNG|nr:MAG: SGF29 tudor-like domain-containing protein [Olpidium bornovanus]